MASDVMKTNNDAYGREGAQKEKDLRVREMGSKREPILNPKT